MRYLVTILLAAAVFGAASPPASAGRCGLPDTKPLWVDYGAPELLGRFGRPGVVVAGSGADYPAKARALGARTVYWDNYLSTRIGTPSAPADRDLLPARAQRVFDFAVLSAGCPDPVIAMNELFGAATPTPWTPTTARYRANVLEWARLLREKGGQPVLLVSSEPYTGGEAGQWWRELAQVSDIALEKYFNANAVHRAGPELGSRRMRASMRGSLAKLFAVGVRPAQLGVVLGFQTKRGSGGREGLEPAGDWFEVAKLQALAARQVARELGLAHIWSWGWGFFNEEARDPDKLGAACVWLWARDPSLCAAGTLPDRFDRNLRAGQIDLPGGVRCALGDATITANQIAGLARVTGDAELALAVLYGRLVQQRAASVASKDVRAAEEAIVRRHFAGSRARYLVALARARASPALAVAAIGDELRRVAIQTRLRVPPPSAAEIAEFAATYAGVELREIPGAGPVPGVDPETPLGLLPTPVARPAIIRALRHAARAGAYEAWAERRQLALLAELRCTHDRLPSIGTARVTNWLPFLVPVGPA
ncbi:MAG TPA: hypothetical protein VM049_01720 [Gaiellaceae bacterium]|nr:hypothetical protein [Gaiellaceae bacterium]